VRLLVAGNVGNGASSCGVFVQGEARGAPRGRHCQEWFVGVRQATEWRGGAGLVWLGRVCCVWEPKGEARHGR